MNKIVMKISNDGVNMVGNIAVNVLSSLIYDICKQIYLGNMDNRDGGNITKFVQSELSEKYEVLFSTNELYEFFQNPLIRDTLHNYVVYVWTGKMEDKLVGAGVEKKKKNQAFTDKDLLAFLCKNLKQRYREQGNYSTEKAMLIDAFMNDCIVLITEYITSKDIDNKQLMYFMNARMNAWGNQIIGMIDNTNALLKASTNVSYVHKNDVILERKNFYSKVLKDNFKMAHIYLLDRFEMHKFYVPPVLTVEETDDNSDYLKRRYRRYYNSAIYENYSYWTHLFDRRNIVYIIGGAGYGKSLLLYKIVCDYEQLNICDAEDYLVIYGDLKNFIDKSSSRILSVHEFLLESMQKKTLLDADTISKEVLDYYLNRGRCLILLDALDEVEKNKRLELQSLIITFFKNLNPNNKICITSRARGFVSGKGTEVEIQEIQPLTESQITKYVDNIIHLGKFDEEDRESFLGQTKELVKKQFLNSFLVLSLLINIYKAERELPENKLELYQKCFDYISNKREKDKSQDRYDWKLINTIMKDSTFVELAKLGMPNNSEISRLTIKERLVELYKNKYGSENETENAIDDFLAFCADRTELFVPASGEDCFKFFHRSFFEYYYSQYLFLQIRGAEGIYEEWKKFDIDSEVFELTLAMFKQKDELRYQEIVTYVLNIIKTEKSLEKRAFAISIFVICLQVIDDESFIREFIDIIVKNTKLFTSKKVIIHNPAYLLSCICSNDEYINKVVEAYRDYCEYDMICALMDCYEDAKERIGHDIGIDDYNKLSEGEQLFESVFYLNKFYYDVYNKKVDSKSILKRYNMKRYRELLARLKIPAKRAEMLYEDFEPICKLEDSIKKELVDCVSFMSQFN